MKQISGLQKFFPASVHDRLSLIIFTSPPLARSSLSLSYFDRCNRENAVQSIPLLALRVALLGILLLLFSRLGPCVHSLSPYSRYLQLAFQPIPTVEYALFLLLRHTRLDFPCLAPDSSSLATAVGFEDFQYAHVSLGAYQSSSTLQCTTWYV